MKRFWILSIVMSFLIILDQITKGAVQSNFYLGESLPLIDGFFNLTYVQNTGAAFGFMADAQPWLRKILFLYLPVVFTLWIFVLLVKTIKEKLILSVAYALIIAGAVGNLIDRFSMGYVVDFFDFYLGRSHYPAFNIADSCISIAAALLILDFIQDFIAKKSQSSATDNI